MRQTPLTKLIFTLVFSLFACAAVAAQENAPPPPEGQNPPPQERPRILEELGLTREQVQQIRRINQERRPLMQQAQQAWREAQRNLDLAIYADNAGEEEIKSKLRAAQLAHGELLKARSTTEYLIRRVLTPEQLQKFRELRERFRQQLTNPNRRQRRQLNRLPLRRNPNRQPPNF